LGVESTVRQVDGVANATAGYEGGHTENLTYKDVCTHSTGHAEVVEIEYDASKVSYEQLLNPFWNEHDPTQVNRQSRTLERRIGP
jgi:peptide-methionine (S)-S-oxide reductase